MKTPFISPRMRIIIGGLMALFIALWFGNQMGRPKSSDPSSSLDWGTLKWGRMPLADGWSTGFLEHELRDDASWDVFDQKSSFAAHEEATAEPLGKPQDGLLFQSHAIRSALADGSFGVVDLATLLGDPRKATPAQIDQVKEAIADTVNGTSVRWVLDSSCITSGGARLVLFADAKTDLTEQVAQRLHMKQRGDSSAPPH